VPQVECEKANAVAARCVRDLQSLAAQLSASELKRRRQAGLSAQQDAMLLRWGYPFVLDHYRLHFSLTGSLKNFNQFQIDSLLAGAALIRFQTAVQPATEVQGHTWQQQR